ncbi:transposase domain protein [Orientia tsutsugamushi str. UT144]|uniref:Transposase domain protein n=1 Tax=Orientia tsutsugamushi str. UT144 TaxID=1441384 RepID=A0A0F3RNC5_ORITS|nr:transposase domain protein [Orientia tsutsugamushi str. UT144]
MISSIPKENLVYIDESGIEMSICKNRWWSKKETHVNSKKSGKYYERQFRIRESMKGIIQKACKR